MNIKRRRFRRRLDGCRQSVGQEEGLSMMGLMLGVGMLIDNAVVVLESIYRRMGLGEDPESATLKRSAVRLSPPR